MLFKSFKVTSLGTNRKPICNFLLVNNSNLYLWPRYHKVLVRFSLSTKEVSLFNALIWGKPLNLGRRNLA